MAIVQPLPGIGDMIWHLPHIRALASLAASGRAALIAKPRSGAEQLFSGESCISDVLPLHRRPERRHGQHDGIPGWTRLVADLRARRFTTVVLLHHSRTLALALCAAGIPERYGYGLPLQRWFLNRAPFLPGRAAKLHPYDRASAYLSLLGIPVADPEPRMLVSSQARRNVQQRIGGLRQPFVALGLGSSEPYKQWGVDNFAALTRRILHAGWPSVAAIGGPAEAGLLEAMLARLPEAEAVRVFPAIGWHLAEVAALLEQSAFYVGNDTGVMNMAAAVGTRSFGLFGGTPPLHHSRRIIAIEPPDAVAPRRGMAAITVDAVVAAIASERGAMGPAMAG